VGEIFAGGKQAETEMEIIGRDGKKISCLVNAYPYLNHKGELVGAVTSSSQLRSLVRIVEVRWERILQIERVSTTYECLRLVRTGSRLVSQTTYSCWIRSKA